MSAPKAESGVSVAPGSALIIDDHPLYCDALSLTLRAIAGFEQIEVAHRLDTALALFEGGLRPALVLLDLDLPDVSGLEGLLRLVVATDAPLLVVSSMDDARLIGAVLVAGASGFVPKHAGRDEFRAALQTVFGGGRYVPGSYAETGVVASAQSGEALTRLAQLTRQQARILELVCSGMLNKQIAWELSIAETTVKAHVTAIMRKLGVQNRTQAVLMAQQARFVSLAPDL